MRAPIVLFVALIATRVVWAQTLMGGLTPGGTGHLFPSDAAALELRELQSSLPCVVRSPEPELGFDFIFHVRYTADVRLRDLAGDGNLLTAVFRITPDGAPERAVYFQQKWSVPPITEDAGGDVLLEGAFSVGEGDYSVDWIMREQQERLCSAHWKISARIPTKAGKTPAGLPPGSVTTTGDWNPEPLPSGGAAAQQLDVTVLLNIGPTALSRWTITAEERLALLSILRSIVRDPRIGHVSITAFSLDRQQVIFEQENIRQTHFADLERSIDSLSLGTIDVNQLSAKDGEARFLVRLAAGHTQRRDSAALIFVGARKPEEAGMTRDLLRELGEASVPVFYLTYSPALELNPWRDLIGSAVKHWRGREFSISKPLDLVSAWSKIMTQLGSARPFPGQEK